MRNAVGPDAGSAVFPRRCAWPLVDDVARTIHTMLHYKQCDRGTFVFVGMVILVLRF